MKTRTMVFAATLGALWFTMQAPAQPEWDIVHVNLPYTVMVGNRTLPPGDYTIQQLHSEASTVLLIYNGNGMKFETSALTIPAVGNTDETPDKTTVSLHHVGDDYYFDKIFIQGKDYGYEFPLPSRVKAREREMTAVALPAQSSITSTSTETSNSTTTSVDTNTTVTAPPPTVDTTPPPTPQTPPDVTTPPPPPEPQPTVDTSQTTPSTDTTVTSEGSANREKQPSDNTMPATSAGWLAMLLSGGTLSGAGMMLRRKR